MNNENEYQRLSADCARSRRRIDYLVVHCSDTRPSQDFTLEKLTACHKARGFGRWPGYHCYIRRDGTLHYCRPIERVGCHVKGYNSHSIGICYEGGRRDLAPQQDQDPLLSPCLGGGKEVSVGRSIIGSSASGVGVSGSIIGSSSSGVGGCGSAASHPPTQGDQRGSFRDTRTPAQKRVMLDVLKLLHSYYPDAKIVGHCELPGVAKICPCLTPKASVEYADLLTNTIHVANVM